MLYPIYPVKIVNVMYRRDGTCWSHTTHLYTRHDQPFYVVVDFPENNGCQS